MIESGWEYPDEKASGGLAYMLGEPTYAEGGRTGFKDGTKKVIEEAILKGPDSDIPPNIRQILDVIGGGVGIATLGLPKWLLTKFMEGGVRRSLIKKHMARDKQDRRLQARQMLTADEPYIGKDRAIAKRLLKRQIPEDREYTLPKEMIESGWEYPDEKASGGLAHMLGE
jgi:hypothetical protein